MSDGTGRRRGRRRRSSSWLGSTLVFLSAACGPSKDAPFIEAGDPAAAQNGSGIDPGEAARLAAMGYLSGYEPAHEKTGVIHWDQELAEAGLNLWISGHEARAFLMDMGGELLHEWALPVQALWPDVAAQGGGDHWRRVHLDPAGDLLAIYEGIGIVALDRDSRVQWSWRGGCHHDLFVTEDEIFVLSRAPRMIPQRHPTLPILEDFVTVLGRDGAVRRKTSVVNALARSKWIGLLNRAALHGDILHTNTIQVLDGRHAARSEAFAAGNYLISMPYVDAIAILDPVKGEVVWAREGHETPRFRMQHDPVMLDDGHVLLFDNMGEEGGLSKVVEFDPLEGTVAWSFGTTAEREFSSIRLGANQRLANGNTLVTDSLSGVALEVSGAGEVVWEFVNPHRSGKGADMLDDFLQQAKAQEGVWDPRLVAQIEHQLLQSADGELAATLLDVVRLSAGQAAWLER